MIFANKEAFYLLFLLIPLVVIFITNKRVRKKCISSFVNTGAYKQLGVRSSEEVIFFKAALIFISALFFIIALARPQWGERVTDSEMKGLEITFLLDTSFSMNAEDLKPNRLEVAKELIASVVNNLVTDYVSLVNFAGVAYVQCPFTVDYDAFLMMNSVSSVSPEEEQGTDFAAAFKTAIKPYENKKDKGPRVFILITDGEDQEKNWSNLTDKLRKERIVVFTVGVGAVSGAPIPVKNSAGKVTGWKKDRQGNIVKTKLGEKVLTTIARDSGGAYFRLSDPAAIGNFITVLKKFERKSLKGKMRRVKIERFHYPLMIGLFFLIIEMFLSVRKLRWKRD